MAFSDFQRQAIQSCPWVGLTRELGWWWVRNFCFQWVGLGHGSEMADFRKMKVVYVHKVYILARASVV